MLKVEYLPLEALFHLKSYFLIAVIEIRQFYVLLEALLAKFVELLLMLHHILKSV